ncbi:MAG: DUF6479 family protein [Bacteroidota bacterium]
MKQQRKRKKHSVRPPAPKGKSFTSPVAMAAVGLVVIAILVLVLWVNPAARETPVQPPAGERQTERPEAGAPKTDTWAGRSLAVTRLFHEVYTPCWEGAYGALGDAYLFALTGDSTLLRFHTEDHDLREMCVGTWVDDRAWVCLAELAWWKVSGRGNMSLVTDAMRRYQEAREEKRLSNHEGFWAWYTYAPYVGYEVFTNSNMNQMVTVACGLYEATGNRKFLEDALLVWNGDGRLPGLEKRWYRGEGRWEGKPGEAAFGKELPWGGTGMCSIGAALYRATGEEKYRDIAVATAKFIMDPANGWVDPHDFYQIRMDGNGAFVHYLMDAYEIAPEALEDLPGKVERMLDHVWTNHHGNATVTLHRTGDHGIRNGWNPHGGEEGYGVGEIGTVHAQGEAARAFGVFAYFANRK